MKWYPQDYLVEPLEGNSHLCIGVKALKNVILGAILMRNYDVFFDRTDKKVGFVRANCQKDPNYFDLYPDDYPRDYLSSMSSNMVMKKIRKSKKKNKKKTKIFKSFESEMDEVIEPVKISKKKSHKKKKPRVKKKFVIKDFNQKQHVLIILLFLISITVVYFLLLQLKKKKLS